MLEDSYGREINYLRLAVTDRCNLRCTYCMPINGLHWLPQTELMSYEEMERICTLLVQMGITKIRITGGEPFIRKGMLPFLEKLSQLKGLEKISITTNGLLIGDFVPKLKEIGIGGINLSLDTLDEDRFFKIANRKGLNKVLHTLDQLLEYDIPVKINTVAMEDQNIEDIIPLVNLTKDKPISVRFIEEMPFSGGSRTPILNWNYKRILAHIQEEFPKIEKIQDPRHSTSLNYHIPHHKGNVGIIAAYSRLFCGDCNRIRITPTGGMRTCLYAPPQFNLKEAMREGKSNQELKQLLIQQIKGKPKNGWDAQKLKKKTGQESMANIGG